MYGTWDTVAAWFLAAEQLVTIVQWLVRIEVPTGIEFHGFNCTPASVKPATAHCSRTFPAVPPSSAATYAMLIRGNTTPSPLLTWCTAFPLHDKKICCITYPPPSDPAGCWSCLSVAGRTVGVSNSANG